LPCRELVAGAVACSPRRFSSISTLRPGCHRRRDPHHERAPLPDDQHVRSIAALGWF